MSATDYERALDGPDGPICPHCGARRDAFAGDAVFLLLRAQAVREMAERLRQGSTVPTVSLLRLSKDYGHVEMLRTIALAYLEVAKAEVN